MKIAIAGGTGFVGTRLVERALAAGHQVLLLVRNAAKAQRQFPGAEIVAYTPKQSGDWQKAISGCDGVVNLAGEPLFGSRWTPNSKQEILESRQIGTQKLVEAIAQAEAKPAVIVSASAIGYYGTSETQTFTEQSPPGNDFLAQVCQAWEAAAKDVEALGTRLAILRIGIVLEKGGGALDRMLPPFLLFGGGPIGSGRQWVSWIHRDDLVNLILKALTDPALSGIFNATAPQPVRMAEFCATLGQVLNRPSWLPVPNLALELLLGEAAQVVLQGQEVQPQHTLSANFEYQHPTLKGALQNILSK